MIVRATQKGFYGDTLRNPGVVFEIDDGHFSTKWMEKTKDEPDAPKELLPQAPKPVEGGAYQGNPLAGKTIAQLRELADEKGVAHEGLGKVELREALGS